MIVRQDLPLGRLAAMIVHAAGESSPGPSLPPDTHAVVLQVPDEVTLLDVASRLAVAGIQHVLVREPDPPYHGAAMAIGVSPQVRAGLRPLLKHLALFK